MKRAPFFLILLFGGILLSRVIFLSPHLGNDADAYRFAMNAEKIVKTLHYVPSRSPGYPLYEIINAPLIVIGTGKLTNLMTMLVSMLGLLAFYLILKTFKVQQPLITLTLFAFIPIVWISSLITMDYWWSLTLLLWSFYLTLKKRHYWGAVFLGMAVGCRLPSALFILPILLMNWGNTRNWWNLIKVFLLFFTVAFISFSPMVLTYGFSYFDFVPYAHSPIIGIYRAIKHIFGIPAFIFLMTALLFALFKLNPKKISLNQTDLPLILAVYVWITIPIAIFLRLPADPAYLLPALPFLLIVLSFWIEKYWWIPIGSLVVLNNFCTFIVVDTDAYKESNQLHVKFCAQGILLKERSEIETYDEKVKALQELDLKLREQNKEAIILVGGFWPMLRYYVQDQVIKEREVGQRPYDYKTARINDRWFGRIVSREDLEKLKKENYLIYYTKDANWATKYTYHYDLAELGAIELPYW